MIKAFTKEEKDRGLNEINKVNAKGYATSVSIDPSKPRKLKISGKFIDRYLNERTTIYVDLKILTLDNEKIDCFPFRDLREDEIIKIHPVRLIDTPWDNFYAV